MACVVAPRPEAASEAASLRRDGRLRHLAALSRSARVRLLDGCYVALDERRSAHQLARADAKARRLARRNRRLSLAHRKGERAATRRLGCGKRGAELQDAIGDEFACLLEERWEEGHPLGDWHLMLPGSSPRPTARMRRFRRPGIPAMRPLPARAAPRDALAQKLLRLRTILEDVDALRPEEPFARLQRDFLDRHCDAICRSMLNMRAGPQGVNNSVLRMSPAGLSTNLRSRVLEDWLGSDALTGTLRPAFHGTDRRNYASIFERGLLIPGSGNGLRVVHGSAHGLGIYTAAATYSGACLSGGFAQATRYDENELLVCAVIDDAVPRMAYGFGYCYVRAESENVRHVGDAMVVFDQRRVAPLFVARSCLARAPLPPPAVFFDWERHGRLLRRLADLHPTQRRAGNEAKGKRRKNLPKKYGKK